jgi:serine/threonine-protein kinase RsbW
MANERWRGPAWRFVGADPENSRQVRDWIRSVIGTHGCPVDVEDAGLVVTELFANAIAHGRGDWVMVGYCLWSEGARVVVVDGGGPGCPRLSSGPDMELGGRGLHLVDALGAGWGSFRLPAAQVVWCDFGQPLCATAANAWAWLPGALGGVTAGRHARGVYV